MTYHPQHSQTQANIRLEWGEHGIHALAPHADAVVIIDVLSFTTCVDICLAQGAIVFPFVWGDQSATDFTEEHRALLAGKRRDADALYSLSPSSLSQLPQDSRLVLPSPNGSTLTLSAAQYTDTYAGCLRNAAALANHLEQQYENIAIIASGERWPDGSLRPALEDWLGAGAIISHLSGSKSPEAKLAAMLYQQTARTLNNEDWISDCSSGRELDQMGFPDDVDYASQIDISQVIAYFDGEKYLDIAEN